MNLKKRTTSVDIQIGRTIAQIRKANGLSQTDLGNALGVTFQQIQKYERGANRISVSAMIEICKTLEISPVDLIGDFVVGNRPQYTRLADEITELKRKISEIKAIAA